MKNNNQITQFHNDEFGAIDILMIDGKPYFPAKECAILLGYKNPRDAIAKHCKRDGVAKRDGVSFTTNQHSITTQQTVERTYISEGNLYRLIIRSKLPAALRFEAWVCDCVLPSLRQYGAYATSDTLDELLRSPKFAEMLIAKLEKERDKSANLEVLTKTWEELAIELAPKAMFCDLVLQSTNLFPVSVIARDYGMSATAFNAMLHDFGIQYKAGGTWLLYQKYARQGYTRTTTYSIDEKIAAIHTRWTQKGRLFLYEFLAEYGIFPQTECDRALAS